MLKVSNKSKKVYNLAEVVIRKDGENYKIIDNKILILIKDLQEKSLKKEGFKDLLERLISLAKFYKDNNENENLDVIMIQLKQVIREMHNFKFESGELKLLDEDFKTLEL